MIIQIYETQTHEEARELVRIGVGHLGTIIRKDDLDNNYFKDLVNIIKSSKRINVFTPLFSEEDLIIKMIEFFDPSAINFCDDVTEESIPKQINFLKTLRKQFLNLKIFRVIPVALEGLSIKIDSVSYAKSFEDFVDFIQIDTFKGKDDLEPGFVGITGKTCDWNIAKQVVESIKKPVILAGGLSPDNVKNAIKKVTPAGVDSCSSTNAVDENDNMIRYKKDLKKVEKFIKNAKL